MFVQDEDLVAIVTNPHENALLPPLLNSSWRLRRLWRATEHDFSEWRQATLHFSSNAPLDGRSSIGCTYTAWKHPSAATHQVGHEHGIPVKIDALSSVGRRDQGAHFVLDSLDPGLDQSINSTVVPRRLLGLRVDPLLLHPRNSLVLQGNERPLLN